MPRERKECPYCFRKIDIGPWKKHVEACLRKKQGIPPPRLRFTLAAPGSGFVNDPNFCGTCYRAGANELVYDAATDTFCAVCSNWGDPRHKPNFLLDALRLEVNARQQEARANSGGQIIRARGTERIDWSRVIDQASGGTLEDRLREFVVTASDDSWRSGGDRLVASAHPSVARLAVELFHDEATQKTNALMCRLRQLNRQDLPKTNGGTHYHQYVESMDKLTAAQDPMFGGLRAATTMILASTVQASIVVSNSEVLRACKQFSRRAAQGQSARTKVAKASKKALLYDGDSTLALLEVNKRRVGVVVSVGENVGNTAWRRRWGHRGDESFGLNCRSSGLENMLNRGGRVYHTVTLEEGTSAGCSYGTKAQLDALLQAFNKKDDDENLVGQKVVSLPYTRPQARDFSEALGSLKPGDRVVLRVAVNAGTVIELGSIRGECRDADLILAYDTYGRRFDRGVYAQRSTTAADDFVRRLLNPGECCGILMNGQDMGGILKCWGETEWRVVGRDCVDHPLDAQICTALDRTLARRVLDYEWTTADVPQDNWTGNKVMRRENLQKVMKRADDAFRTYKVVFARFRAALDDDEADTAAVLRACYDRLEQGCATMGAERFMAEVRAEFQAKHADDIARELLRPRKVEIISVNIHDAKAEPQSRVVLVERQGLDDLKDALTARLATRVAEPRDMPASALEGLLGAKLAGLPSELLASVAEAADQKLDGDARPRTRPQPPQRAFDNDLAEALPEAGPPKSRSPRGSLTRLTPLEQLEDMGFKNERQNEKALRVCRGDVNQAALWLAADNAKAAANTRGRGRGDAI